MNLEIIRKRLSSQLRNHFPIVNEVRGTVVSPLDLTGPLLKNEVIYGFEFIINNTERYHTFAVERDRDVYFTRPKEGIRQDLTMMIRTRDFRLMLTEDPLNHQDVIGKFLENKLCQGARDYVEEVVSTYSHYAKEELQMPIHICQGFVIRRFHKQVMSYDADIELLIKRVDSTEYSRFTGKIESGLLKGLKDSKGTPVLPRDIYATI